MNKLELNEKNIKHAKRISIAYVEYKYVLDLAKKYNHVNYRAILKKNTEELKKALNHFLNDNKSIRSQKAEEKNSQAKCHYCGSNSVLDEFKYKRNGNVYCSHYCYQKETLKREILEGKHVF